jgi:chromosome partitioning protein
LLTKDFSLPREFPDREIYPDLAREGLTVFDLHNKAAVEQQQVWLPLVRAIEMSLASK